MARFMVKASEFKNICKAVNDRLFEEIRNEMIEILKKQDEKEVKKAVDYFESQENHYTHLEKSLDGKWIVKAGYGVGTVRIWKGKKYKKIAPGKWARVFDKEGRGTNIAMGKLLSELRKIPKGDFEKLMQFSLMNKQRFVDENGIDLPVLDKLRNVIDTLNNDGSVGSKEKKNDNPYEITDEERKQVMNNPKTKLLQMADAVRNAEEGTREYDNALKDFQDAREKFIEEQGMEEYKKIMPEYPQGKKTEKKEDENVEKFPGKTLESKKKQLEKLKSRLSDLKSKDIELTHRSQGNWGDGMRLSKLPSNKAWENNREKMDGVKAKIDILEKEIYDEEHKPYWIQDTKGNRLTNEDAKEKIKVNLKKIDELSKGDEARKDIKIRDLKNENDYLMERLNQNDKRDMEIAAKFYENEESEAEKYQNRSDGMNGNENAVKVGGDKKVIGTFTKKDDNSVEMDATKENKVIFDSLNKALSKDKTRAFMTDVYYDGEYLNSTNGYSLVSVKVGDIGLDKGFVKVDSNNGKINVSAIPDKHSDYIPPYKTVIPENNNQEVNIDNKKLKEKLKVMKAEGAYTKDNPIIAFEFKDGNVILDDTVIGKSDAKFADDKNAIYFVADNLSNMITNNKDSTMFVSDNPEKAIAFSDDSSDIVLMPAKETVLNYEGRRNIKKENDEYEAKTKQKRQDAMNSIVDTQKDSMSNEWVQSLINKVNNKEMENHKTIIEHSYKALKDAEKMIEKPTKKWTSSLANNKYGYSLLAAVRKNPEFKTALENMAMEYGLIKKSLFDDFIVDVFAADDEEELEEELYAGETEYNDYSAEQPELFNSTAMKVREAMDRIRNQVL